MVGCFSSYEPEEEKEEFASNADPTEEVVKAASSTMVHVTVM